MSSFEDWKPLTAFCMLGAVISEQAVAVRFPAAYGPPPRETRDRLFAQALHETAADYAAGQGTLASLFIVVKLRLETGVRMDGMRTIAWEAFGFVGIPPRSIFILPSIDRAKDLLIILTAHLQQHPEWKEPAMAVSDRYISLLEELQRVSQGFAG